VTSNLTPERATERAFERAWVIWPLLLIAVGDGELTQDLLYCPPIERRDFAVGEGAVAAGRTVAAARTAGGRASHHG
jgi:hypothetical protein